MYNNGNKSLKPNWAFFALGDLKCIRAIGFVFLPLSLTSDLFSCKLRDYKLLIRAVMMPSVFGGLESC